MSATAGGTPEQESQDKWEPGGRGREKALQSEASVGAKAVKGRGGNALVTHWLALHTFTNKGMCSIPGGGTKILQDVLAQPQ